MTFDMERSRRYWRLAPSGQGKHDTTAWSTASDAELARMWDAAFQSRFETYPEEDVFARTMAERLRGCSVVSVGSGLGFHELLYASAGARMTCLDIVPSNLEVIARIAGQKRIPIATAIADTQTTFPPEQDVVMLYGCLMHMPVAAQRDLLARAAGALAPHGRLLLMLYTWTFVARTCGWERPDQFDPHVFARASDPTVGTEDCPWSDWHDDAKLLDLLGLGFRITRRQEWNDDQFVWYEVEREAAERTPERFFAADALAMGQTARSIPARSFMPQDATVQRWFGRLTVTTTSNQFSYALVSPVIERADLAPTPSLFAFDLAVQSGRISAGVLDVDRGTFVSTQTASAGAPLLVVPCREVPARFQLVLSNHSERRPSVSRFVFRKVRAVFREPLVMSGQA